LPPLAGGTACAEPSANVTDRVRLIDLTNERADQRHYQRSPRLTAAESTRDWHAARDPVVDPAPDRRRPRPAIGIVEQVARRHLGQVGLGVERVGLGVVPAEPPGEHRAGGGLAVARDPPSRRRADRARSKASGFASGLGTADDGE
jgi:hypothetical protein